MFIHASTYEVQSAYRSYYGAGAPAGLPESHGILLHAYSRGDADEVAKQVNRSLWDQGLFSIALPPSIQAYCAALDEAIASYRALRGSYVGTVYRFLSVPSPKDFTARYQHHAEDGTAKTEWGYTSTSKFMLSSSRLGRLANVLFVIQQSSGIDLEPIAYHGPHNPAPVENQHEVLLPRGWRANVLDVTLTDTGRYDVLLEEVL